jgi:hypothetical protein
MIAVIGKSRLAVFNEATHTEIAEAKPVDEFNDISADDDAMHGDLPAMSDAAEFYL